jgi:translation initiation factor 1
MKTPGGRARLVWSSERGNDNTNKGKACSRCGAEPCRCEPVRSLPPAGQTAVRVRREKGGRGGKTVTVAGPLALTRDDAAALLASWKRLCGGGGTLRTVRTAGGDAAFEVEVQGDHADRVLAALVEAGYPAKRSGG